MAIITICGSEFHKLSECWIKCHFLVTLLSLPPIHFIGQALVLVLWERKKTVIPFPVLYPMDNFISGHDISLKWNTPECFSLASWGRCSNPLIILITISAPFSNLLSSFWNGAIRKVRKLTILILITLSSAYRKALILAIVFSIPFLIIINMKFVFLTDAAHWVDIFIHVTSHIWDMSTFRRQEGKSKDQQDKAFFICPIKGGCEGRGGGIWNLLLMWLYLSRHWQLLSSSTEQVDVKGWQCESGPLCVWFLVRFLFLHAGYAAFMVLVTDIVLL